MNQSYSLAAAQAALIALCMVFPAQADPYISGDFGMNFGSSLDLDVADNDRPSVCDEYINPDTFDTWMSGDTDCTAARTGDMFTADFDKDQGVLFALAIGRRLGQSNWRPELEYFYRDTDYDDAFHEVVGAGGADQKARDEIQVATQRLGNMTSHNLFLNLYYDFPNLSSRYTPYVGFGAGFAYTEMDYGTVFQRNGNPAYIKTGSELPNAGTIQTNLAGTVTTEDERLDDRLFGYQFLLGLDYPLTEHLVVGLKGRYVIYDAFRDRNAWDTLRSHPSNLRRDGSEPVAYKVKIDDPKLFAISVNLKYQFDPMRSPGPSVLRIAPLQAAGLYISGDFGMNFGSSLDSNGATNDRASVCDEYINPHFATVTDDGQGKRCTDPGRGRGDGWDNRFDSDEGVLFALALGYRQPDSPLRTEFEYFYRDTGFDEISAIPSATGVNQDKIVQEIVTAVDRIASMTSHNLFTNLYLDFAGTERLTPYVGVGVGVGFTEVDYGSVWSRNTDPDAIRTGAGLSNAAEIRQNLAATTSVVDDELRDTLFGYQLIAGLDYLLTDHLMVGLKGRWVHYEDFKESGIVWDPLRSHPPYLRKSGADREKVEGAFKLDDIELFGISLNLKYLF